MAPPSLAMASGFSEIAAFGALPLAVSPLDAGRTTLVASDDDPFNPEGAQNSFGRPLSLPTVVLPGQGHFTPDSGYGDWPSLLEWCVDPATNISASAAPARSTPA